MFLKYVSILAISVVAAGHASAASYDVVVLQDVGADGDSGAQGINDFGQVVGSSFTSNDQFDAVLWSANGTGMVLRDVGGTGRSEAFAINNSGQIVGASISSIANLGTEAVVWSPNGTGKALQDVGGAGLSIAVGINSSGQIVGLSAGGGAVQWSASTGAGMLLHGISIGNQAIGTNDFGQIVGFSGSDAVLWTSATAPAKALENVGGGSDGSEALAINGFGQSVGFSSTANGQDAALWGFGGGGIALQDVGGAGDSIARDINDAGQIVGESQTDDGSGEAVLWSTTGVGTSLADVLGSDWTNTQATGINNQGEIVGSGSFMGSASTAFLLIPRSPIVAIPEPSTWVMMLAGFAGLGFLGCWAGVRDRPRRRPVRRSVSKREQPSLDLGAP
jgi:probable HAF family extracellular repeat protein